MVLSNPFIPPVIQSIYMNMMDKDWEIYGLLAKNGYVYPTGYDTKIIGRVFEILMAPILNATAHSFGYRCIETHIQNIYPDFIFDIGNGQKIAIDIKSTYRNVVNNHIQSLSFTLGSFTSYIRNDTKNIYGNYNDYVGHIIVGFVYTRNTVPQPIRSVCNFSSIQSPYHNVEFFVQEKFRIAGQTPGSGNTNNIGSIKSNNIDDFANGLGFFSFLGEGVFREYWKNYPISNDTNRKYRNLEEFFHWLISQNYQNVDPLIIIYDNWKRDYGTRIS